VTVLVRPEQIDIAARNGVAGLARRIVACGYHGHDAVVRMAPDAEPAGPRSSSGRWAGATCPRLPGHPARPRPGPGLEPVTRSYSSSRRENAALLPLTDSYIRSVPLLLAAPQEYI